MRSHESAGNTRVVGQVELDKFREDMTTAAASPYTVVLNQGKVPFGLLADPFKNARMNLLSTESFGDTFGKNARRKRPKLGATDVSAMVSTADAATANYDPAKDSSKVVEVADMREPGRHVMFNKGQSNRIWTELYKVCTRSLRFNSRFVLVMPLTVRHCILSPHFRTGH